MSKTILVADDSVTIQRVVELTFLAEDYRVESVADGDSALTRLEELGPDLLIAGVHMPGAAGYDVCKRAKELRPEAPVLLLVGALEEYDSKTAEACGADGHLKKPFDSQELLRQATELMGEPDAAMTGEEAMSDTVDGSDVGQDEAAEPRSAAVSAELSDEQIEKIARRVVELLSEQAVREVAWEVVPDLAEVVIRDRLQELESQVE